jgi:hypothetical protein
MPHCGERPLSFLIHLAQPFLQAHWHVVLERGRVFDRATDCGGIVIAHLRIEEGEDHVPGRQQCFDALRSRAATMAQALNG